MAKTTEYLPFSSQKQVCFIEVKYESLFVDI